MLRTGRAAELAVRNVGKSYGHFKALQDVSLTIGRGEFVTLLGPSGSGKTTFLMILAGFIKASSGTLARDGIDITDQPPEKRGFGMVFQGYALFPHMTVERNIAFPLEVQKRPASEIRSRVAEMIETVGLHGHAGKRPGDLSGGQQQRVALARALAPAPSVLLLDEPFSALDKNLRGAMQDEMRRIHRESGTTFVFVTHDQSEALALSNRIAIFDKGRLQQVGSPREVYDRPANRFVAEFLGDINIVDVTDVRPDDGGFVAACAGHTIRLAGDAGSPGGAVALRPEYVLLSRDVPASGNHLPVTVRSATYQGGQMHFETWTEHGTRIKAAMPTHQVPPDFSEGARIHAGWRTEDGYFL